MILTGPKIREEIKAGRIEIDPFLPEHVGPNSVDLRLGNELKVYTLMDSFRAGQLDMREKNSTRDHTIREGGFRLEPGTLYLGTTMERTYTPHHVPMVEGRSSIGRLGIKVHVTAGFGDVGFNGKWTLEIEVTHPVVIYPFERFCQVYFTEVVGDIQPYEGRYQGQTEITPSRFWQG